MYFSIVVFFTLFSSGKAIRCYQCYTTDEEKCIASQESNECGAARTCMTLQYEEKRTKSVKPFYQKTCSTNFQDCQNHCGSGLPGIVKNCKVLQCCDKDNCNEKIEREKSNSKRSTYNSQSISINNRNSLTLIIALSLLATFGYRVLQR